MGTLALTIINVILTGVISIAVIAQAWFTYKQAEMLEQSEKRTRDRDKPRVGIIPLSHNVVTLGATTRSFEGFTVTNAGFMDIEISSIGFEVGRVLRSVVREEAIVSEISFPHVLVHEQATLSTVALPHRLRPGESFKVQYDEDMLVRESLRIGGSTPIHMRPYCMDSLGNRHTMKHWIAYGKGRVGLHDSPSPGRISEEDWRELSKDEQRKWQWKSILY